MRSERFFKDERLSFAEVRYSRESSASFKPHIHQKLSIGAIGKGSAIFQIGNEKVSLAPGEIAIVNPEIIHSCNPEKKQKRSYYMLFLDTQWCLRIQQSMWNVDVFVRPEKTKIANDKLYQDYCHAMGRLIDNNVHLEEKEQLLYDLCCTIFAQCVHPHEGVVKQRNQSIEELKRTLQNDLENDLPLGTLAAGLTTNPYSLIRRFKEVTGITPHAYRMNCRIEHAKELLQKGWEITDAALQCGFFDQSHFHRYFKAMTTITPRQYRVNFVQ